jgi:hypothetical protein
MSMVSKGWRREGEREGGKSRGHQRPPSFMRTHHRTDDSRRCQDLNVAVDGDSLTHGWLLGLFAAFGDFLKKRQKIELRVCGWSRVAGKCRSRTPYRSRRISWVWARLIAGRFANAQRSLWPVLGACVCLAVPLGLCPEAKNEPFTTTDQFYIYGLSHSSSEMAS